MEFTGTLAKMNIPKHHPWASDEKSGEGLGMCVIREHIVQESLRLVVSGLHSEKPCLIHSE